jgi:hypothetical protein
MSEEGADPPTNLQGKWICARACVNGSRCLQRVTTPNAACVVHEEDSPVVPPGGVQNDE